MTKHGKPMFSHNSHSLVFAYHSDKNKLIVPTKCIQLDCILLPYSCQSYIDVQKDFLVTAVLVNHRKYAHVTPIQKRLYWLPANYCCMFKTSTLVYKFLHSGSPSYFGSCLSLSSCSYSTGHSHPDGKYLTVLPFHSSLHMSNTLANSFAFDAPKI